MRIVKSPEEEMPILRALVRDLGEYYFTPLTDKQVEMYAEDLLPMGSELALKAASKYRKSFYNNKFPVPATLKRTVYFFDRNNLKTP
jgi:hypothetical protein